MNTTVIDNLLKSTYGAEEYPVLLHQIEQWAASMPFKGLTLLDSTPIFRNTLAKHRALIAAGARLIVGTSDIISYDPKIIKLLRESGIELTDSSNAPMEVDIILDCAGVYSHWKPRVGFVELTRSGVDKYNHTDMPVFVADGGRIKRIETCLGTGESYFRAMKELGYNDWAGRKVVIFGSGKVGAGIATYAYKVGAEVIVVTDPQSVSPQIKRLCSRIVDYSDGANVGKVVMEAYAVVMATGIAGAFGKTCPSDALLNSSALFANMGAEDEFGDNVPDSRVMQNKRTLNFILEEPTHLKYIDATMALHNEGALYITTHASQRGLIEPPIDMEERLLNICRKDGCIGDELEMIF